jgi:carbon monoxide dehydrogenase subunit G
MQVNFTNSLNLSARQSEVWQLLRDTKRLAALIPGVQSIALLDENRPSKPPAVAGPAVRPERSGVSEKYQAHIVESIGPFRMALDLQIGVIEALEPSRLKAQLGGVDVGGHNRISGTLTADLEPSRPQGTLLTLAASIEILGKLAALGAAPIRRRASELFGQFASRVQQQFQSSQAAQPHAVSAARVVESVEGANKP